MTSFSQNDHLKSYQDYISYFEIEIDYLKQENLYHDGDSKYENNFISLRNSFSIELNVINIGINEKENAFSDIDFSTIKHEESKDSEELSMIEIQKENESLKLEDDNYPEKEILYLKGKKSVYLHPKNIVDKRIRIKNKKNQLVKRPLSYKRKMHKKNYNPKFKYKNCLLNTNSIKLILFFHQKNKTIFDCIKNSKKNRNESNKKKLGIIKSIIRQRFNIKNHYLKRRKKFRIEISDISDENYKRIYRNVSIFKVLFKRKSCKSKYIILRNQKNFMNLKFLKLIYPII